MHGGAAEEGNEWERRTGQAAMSSLIPFEPEAYLDQWMWNHCKVVPILRLDIKSTLVSFLFLDACVRCDDPFS